MGVTAADRGHSAHFATLSPSVVSILERETDDSTVEALVSLIERAAEGQVKWEGNEELALVD